MGQAVSVYQINGKLIYNVVSQSDKLTIPVQKNAIYLVKIDQEIFKVAF